ncbi:helix-turn-helix transcriptional regulator [Sorangium sp. So ce726]|uniref:helix-turn-helix domain-containing protein n=1 Tax=Sorangium sp. So ce726 TaxID=3133319 RepID=UPI003F61DF4A
MIGRQCTRDGRTVCLRMSQTGLPVNQEERGLSLVYGWASEERRAQGIPASIQGVEFRTDSGKVLAFDFCPFCGEKLAGSTSSVRAPVARRTASESARTEPQRTRTESQPAAVERAQRAGRAVEAVPPTPPSAPARAQAAASSTTLKVLREKLGLSQAELGEKLGLARSSVANYENGRSPLSQRLRKWVAKHEAKLNEGGSGAAGRGNAAA